MIVCSREPARLHCKFCCGIGRPNVPATKLCDYPLGRGRTCDAPLCDRHATRVGENNDNDRCPIHKEAK